ncbi:hypothetical protein M8J77_008745 [Diaphorina citri]|nr:hypothetical protein M8J77_008745 [Diaphorina citri]
MTKVLFKTNQADTIGCTNLNGPVRSVRVFLELKDNVWASGIIIFLVYQTRSGGQTDLGLPDSRNMSGRHQIEEIIGPGSQNTFIRPWLDCGDSNHSQRCLPSVIHRKQRRRKTKQKKQTEKKRTKKSFLKKVKKQWKKKKKKEEVKKQRKKKEQKQKKEQKKKKEEQKQKKQKKKEQKKKQKKKKVKKKKMLMS